ncbi:MAG: hypothetical protein EBQ67_04450 [Sphingobacteriia bacterium]|nr:hypothetical protein [Sphingobacteriia bacterium]
MRNPTAVRFKFQEIGAKAKISEVSVILRYFVTHISEGRCSENCPFLWESRGILLHYFLKISLKIRILGEDKVVPFSNFVGFSLIDLVDLLDALWAFLGGRCYGCIQIAFCMNGPQKIVGIHGHIGGIMQNGRLSKPLCGVLKDFAFRFLQGQ